MRIVSFLRGTTGFKIPDAGVSGEKSHVKANGPRPPCREGILGASNSGRDSTSVAAIKGRVRTWDSAPSSQPDYEPFPLSPRERSIAGARSSIARLNSARPRRRVGLAAAKLRINILQRTAEPVPRFERIGTLVWNFLILPFHGCGPHPLLRAITFIVRLPNEKERHLGTEEHELIHRRFRNSAKLVASVLKRENKKYQKIKE
jgi:hypothetical protein